jgi:hypothetical protein
MKNRKVLHSRRHCRKERERLRRIHFWMSLVAVAILVLVAQYVRNPDLFYKAADWVAAGMVYWFFFGCVE